MTFFLFALLMLGCFFWGAFTVRNQIFPYSVMRRAAALVRRLREGSRTKVQSEGPEEKEEEVPPGGVARAAYDILFVGDSLVYGGRWASFFPEKRVYNAAMMGETTRGALRYIESVAVLRIPRAFIMLGAKDFESVGYRCATDKDLDETMRNYDKIVSDMRAQGTEVAILAALRVNQYLRGAYPNPHIDALNRRLAVYAEKIGAPFIDLNADFSDDAEGLKAAYTYDGIKLTDEAYRIWADRLREWI